MKFPKEHSLKEIAALIQADYVGDASFPVLGMNEIHRVESGDIVFVDHPKYYEKALESKASVVLINKKVACPEGKTLLISQDPFTDFNRISAHFRSFQADDTGEEKPRIGEGSFVHSSAIIGHSVVIGRNCQIHAQVVLQPYTLLGDEVIIMPGTVIGADAFYYKRRSSGYDRLKSIGNVVIEDRVEIGANCSIDRGVTASTRIGEGTKIDNMVQIGHDTEIGKHCLIASQVGLAGCCQIADEVTLWGQVGMASGATIGAKAIILGKTGITKSLEGGKVYAGNPATEVRNFLKQQAVLRGMVKK